MSRGVLKPSYLNRPGYHAMLLGGIAMICSAALVLGNLRTRDAIAARQAEDLQRSLEQVLPATLHDNRLLDDAIVIESDGHPRTVYVARKEGVVTGAAFEIVGKGYSGDVVSIMAVDASGTILGVRVTRHSETPGLGDKIEIKKTPWIESFNGHSLGNPDEKGWAVKKDGGIYDQFTGATITPRAVVASVQEGLQFFTAHRPEITADKPAQPAEASHAE